MWNSYIPHRPSADVGVRHGVQVPTKMRLQTWQQAGFASVVTLMVLSEGSDIERSNVERSGVERSGVERSGVERSGVERNGGERSGVEGEKQEHFIYLSTESGVRTEVLLLRSILCSANLGTCGTMRGTSI